MNRRTFLTLARSIAVGAAVPIAWPSSLGAAPIDRTSKWQPNPTDVVQWRYAAGRITDSGEDYGFIVSISETKVPPQSQELLVERQDFTGNQAFKATSYPGTYIYNSSSRTYTFQASPGQASATWQWDDGAQVYRLSVSSPELSLSNVVLRPQGDVIPEGGDGIIGVGERLGIQVGSDYHADWAAIEIGGVQKGFARVDMQGLYPVFQAAAIEPAQTGNDYDHHWFAVAGQSDGKPVWISAWRIETENGPFWDVTIAQGSHGTAHPWSVSSTTEESTAVAPLAVSVLASQPLGSLDPSLSELSTGQRWRITAGVLQPGDLIDLDIAVPPGQFVTDARLGAAGDLLWIEEAVGVVAAGTVAGKPLTNVTLAVAETTAEFYLRYMPLVQR
jgi:hypothetical protein